VYDVVVKKVHVHYLNSMSFLLLVIAEIDEFPLQKYNTLILHYG